MKTDKNKKIKIPRTIPSSISNYKDKVKILRNAKKLKLKNNLINEDFYQTTLDHGTVRSFGGGKTFKGGM